MSLRRRFFNWLTEGKIQLAEPEKKMAYSITGAGGSGGYPIGGLSHGSITIGGTEAGQQHFPAAITIRLTPANGGTIVSINHSGSGIEPELYIIGEQDDFDTSLGKIITMARLKAK